ncbi:hypothetical protein Tco_1281916 [Tanacetum coccineum]
MAFIRGEAAAGIAEVVRTNHWDKGGNMTRWSKGQERSKGRSSQREFRRNMGTCAVYARRETFTPLTKNPKEILTMEIVNSHHLRHCDNARAWPEQDGPDGVCYCEISFPLQCYLIKNGMRSLAVVGSAIYSMIKFTMASGVATLKTSKEALR